MKHFGKSIAVVCLLGLLTLIPLVTRSSEEQTPHRGQEHRTSRRSGNSSRERLALSERETRGAVGQTPPPAFRSRESRPAAGAGAAPQGDSVSNQSRAIEEAGDPAHSDLLEIGDAGKRHVLPLIYRLKDEEFLSHFPQMTPEVVESLRVEFEMNAGVGELAPDDPEYIARWEHAEMTLRDRIRMLYGWAAWSDYERQLAMQAEADRIEPMSK